MRAIDMHVHPGTREYLIDSGGKYISDALSYFHRHDAVVSMEEMVAYYRRIDMKAVLLAWDAETATVFRQSLMIMWQKRYETTLMFSSVSPRLIPGKDDWQWLKWNGQSQNWV